jgi:hypothetical protein
MWGNVVCGVQYRGHSVKECAVRCRQVGVSQEAAPTDTGQHYADLTRCVWGLQTHFCVFLVSTTASGLVPARMKQNVYSTVFTPVWGRLTVSENVELYLHFPIHLPG